jgi:non-homologous end joining protein Ku
MRKTIKLTERDLSRIVKRVIKEDNEKDEMEGMGMSITVRDIFDEVRNALHDLRGYDDASMGEKAMDLAKMIMRNMQYELGYISENYEEQLYEILDDEGDF